VESFLDTENTDDLPFDLPYEGYEYPEFQEVIDECRERFEEWRDPFLRGAYKSYIGWHSGEWKKKRENEFVKNAGTGGSYSATNGMPGKTYFDEILVPTFIHIAKSPEEIREMTRVAIAALSKMIFPKDSTRSATYEFFRYESPLHPNYYRHWHHDSARHQFTYFYTLGDELITDEIRNPYRNKDEYPTSHPPPTEQQRRETNEALILAAAADHRSQQWQISGGYEHRLHSLDHMTTEWEEAYETIAPQFRARVFRAFAAYGGGRHHAYPFIAKIPKTFQAITEAGKGHLLDDFASLVEEAPDTEYEHREGFPIFKPEETIAELEALQKSGEYHDDLLQLGKFIIKCNRRYGKIRDGLTFLTEDDQDDDEEKKWHFSSKEQPRQTIKDLEKAGYTPEQIHEILRLPTTHPWLGENSVHFIRYYQKIDKNFPRGGAKRLLKYLETIKTSPDCVRALIFLVEDDDKLLPKRNLKKFLEIGQEVAQKLGNAGSDYFSRFTSAPGKLTKKAEENPDELEKMIQRAIRLARTFDNKHSDWKHIFDIYLRYHQDPRLKDLVKGLRLFRDTGKQYFRDVKKDRRRNEFSYKAITERVSGFVEQLWGLSQSKDDGQDANGFERQARLHNTLPPDVNIEEQMRILSYIHFIVEDSYGHLIDPYFERVSKGCDHRIAARIFPARTRPIELSDGEHYRPLEFGPEIPGVESPVETELIKEVLGEIEQAHKEIARSNNTNVGKKTTKRIATPRRLGYENEDEPKETNMSLTEWLNDDTLAKRLKLLHERKKDPALKTLGQYLDNSIAQIEQSLKLLVFKKILHFPTLAQDIGFNLPPGEMAALKGYNQHTQMAITGISLLTALGITNIAGMDQSRLLPVHTEFHPERLLASQTAGNPMDQTGILSTYIKDNIGAISRNLRMLVPHIRQLIHEERTLNVGKMGIGGKIHTMNPMSQSSLRIVMDMFELDSSPFKLIHADDSLLLPPMPTSLELKMLISLMDTLGVVDKQKPEIQFGTGLRLDPSIVGLMGSSMLLGTSRGFNFKQGAFSTTHDDQTRARIMAYDAGVVDETLPFQPKNAPEARGRTDKLGSRILSDADLMNTLGTLGAHIQLGGRHADIAHNYFSRYLGLLEEYQLRDFLDMAPWVHDPKNPDNASQEDHEAMVRKFTEAWSTEARMPGNGAIGQVKLLIAKADAQMQDRAADVMREEPDESERMILY
jgi:hypothetical protein